MKESKHCSYDRVGQDLDVGTLTLAALGAGRGERQTSFNIVFNLEST